MAPRARDLVLYNHSPSMPVGLYWRVSANAAPAHFAKGTIVTVRAVAVAPEIAAVRHFDGPKNRFIKRVAATGGDRVCAAGKKLTINADQQIERRVALDANQSGKAAILAWSGCRVLAQNEVLLLGETEDSFDGRYWGPISIEQIEGVWRHL